MRESIVYPSTLTFCFLSVLFRCNYCKGGGSYIYFHVNVAPDEFEKKNKQPT